MILPDEEPCLERGAFFIQTTFVQLSLNCTSKDLYICTIIFNDNQHRLEKQRMMIAVSQLESKMDAGGGVDDRRFSEAFARGAFFLQTKFHINCIS